MKSSCPSMEDLGYETYQKILSQAVTRKVMAQHAITMMKNKR